MSIPMNEQQLADLRAIADRATDRPLFVSDCEGELEVWVESALEHVARADDGTITGYSMPSTYRSTDQVLRMDLDTWDLGEDASDDQRRQDINDLVNARAAVDPLLAEVDRLRLSPHERLMLKFALEMAGDVIASNPSDFTDDDQAAMDRLRVLATGPVVAYRNPWQSRVLLCREHGEGWAGLKPLSSEDLPDGGICTYGDPADPGSACGRDVLAGDPR
jgi:hypothetical protein